MAELHLKHEGAPCKFEGADQVLASDLYKLVTSIVFIDTRTPLIGKATGSIVKLKDQHLLMTCNHVFPTEAVAKNSYIYFDRENDGDKPGIMVKGVDLFCFGYFQTCPKQPNSLDVTLIAINTDQVPKFGGQQRLELELSDYKRAEPAFSLKKGDEVKLWHYPEDGSFCLYFSSYTVNAVSGHLFTHSAETHPGSSGAPLFKICDRKPVVVGLHRGALENWDPHDLNLGTRIHAIVCLLEGTDHGLEAVDANVFGKKVSCSKEGSSKVSVESESSGQGYFDSEAFMMKYPTFPAKVKAQSIALKLNNIGAIGDDVCHKIDNTYEEKAGELLYRELLKRGTPDKIKKVCKAMKDERGNDQMNKLGTDMLADPDLDLPCKPN